MPGGGGPRPLHRAPSPSPAEHGFSKMHLWAAPPTEEPWAGAPADLPSPKRRKSDTCPPTPCPVPAARGGSGCVGACSLGWRRSPLSPWLGSQCSVFWCGAGRSRGPRTPGALGCGHPQCPPSGLHCGTGRETQQRAACLGGRGKRWSGGAILNNSSPSSAPSWSTAVYSQGQDGGKGRGRGLRALPPFPGRSLLCRPGAASVPAPSPALSFPGQRDWGFCAALLLRASPSCWSWGAPPIHALPPPH